MIHKDIPSPFKAKVAERILYNMDLSRIDLLNCNVFAISSYKNYALTYSIELNGAIFSNIPGHIFGKEFLELKDISYKNCPSNKISIIEHNFLKNKNAWCFFKHKKIWLSGIYKCTVDWYNDNELVHIIHMNNGSIASLPSHKILFVKDKPNKLPDYKKLKQEWAL